MAISQRKRLVNSHLGIYFSIFASVFIALFLTLLILQELGTPDIIIRMSVLIITISIFIVIGVASYTNHTSDFFAAGRCVPAICTGLVLAASAVGGSGLIIMTGLFFIDGFDTWCIPIGMLAGFVMMGTMVAPFYRKHGSYTVPSYLGQRFASKGIRIVAAAIFAVPMLLLVTAELSMAAYATGLLTGFSKTYNILILSGVLCACISFGGMRALSSVGSAQAIAALIGIIVLVAIIGVIETNLPIAQLSYGPVLRAVDRMEATQQIPVPDLPIFAFDLAQHGLTYLKSRMADPYSSLTPLSFFLTSLTVMLGIACAPWLLPASGSTMGVYESRKALSWTVFFIGIIVLTLSALAVFLRNNMLQSVVGRSPANLPEWFVAITSLGQASAASTGGTLALSNIAFDRDGVLFALPVAADLPPIVLYLILAGTICAALAAAAFTLYALATLLSEDILLGLDWRPVSQGMRLASARLICVIATCVGTACALIVATDPLQLLLWALSISAATAFPVIIFSIWWKDISMQAAFSSLVAGFVTSIFAIVSGDSVPIPLPTPINGLLGIIPACAAAFITMKLGTTASQQMKHKVRELRIPGGETIYDREQRLLRLKEQQRSK